MRTFAPLLLCALISATAAPSPDVSSLPQSQWVRPQADGRLAYEPTATGDHIVDFSYAGYRSGGVAIPEAAVTETLAPTGADDTAALQAALDRVAARAAQAHAPQALLLAPGDFHLSAPIHLAASNVVLRGSGRDKTTVTLTGTPHIGLQVGLQTGLQTGQPSSDADDDTAPSPQAAEPDTSAPTSTAHTTLAEVYVPSGTRTLPVVSAAGFATGDTLLIKRSIPPAYLHFMGMDHLERNSRTEHWVGSSLTTERRIATVRGNTLILDVPSPTTTIPASAAAAAPPFAPCDCLRACTTPVSSPSLSPLPPSPSRFRTRASTPSTSPPPKTSGCAISPFTTRPTSCRSRLSLAASPSTMSI
jgi:hypothetical protein